MRTIRNICSILALIGWCQACPAESGPARHEYMWFNVTNSVVAAQFATSSVTAIRQYCEQRCGLFMTNSTFAFDAERRQLTAHIEIDERLRMMTGLVTVLDISPKDVLFEYATAKRWDVAGARCAATNDIANGSIAIFWQPSIATHPCGIPPSDWELVREYPRADEANGGCIMFLPPHVLKYGAVYNQVIVEYLKAR